MFPERDKFVISRKSVFMIKMYDEFTARESINENKKHIAILLLYICSYYYLLLIRSLEQE